MKETIDALDKSIRIVNRSLRLEHQSVEHDRFGRRACEMPPCLRKMYETGNWREQNVYLWPSVLRLSIVGHRRAATAEKALDPFKYSPTASMSSPQTITETAIRTAAVAAHRATPRVRRVIEAQRAATEARRKDLARQYVELRREWRKNLDEQQKGRSEKEIRAVRDRDRYLMLALHGPVGGGLKGLDNQLKELERSGGSCGGYERWSKSVTKIPDQDPNYLPPACDGSGVLIENPLDDHYASRNINPWTTQERRRFLEKFVAHGKNFRKIATFFEHKSNEDVVRFYFDNKKQFTLKQFARDGIRKRSAKKATIIGLSIMPFESRSIRDNFTTEDDAILEGSNDADDIEASKEERFSQGALGRAWSAADRRSLIFALCRFDVTEDDESKPVQTVWSKIAAIVESKTPRQCRQFYFQYKNILGLEGYCPPRLSPSKRVSLEDDDECEDSDEENGRKAMRRPEDNEMNGNPDVAGSDTSKQDMPVRPAATPRTVYGNGVAAQ